MKQRGFVKQKPGLHFLKGVFLDKILFKQTLSGEEKKAEFQFGEDGKYSEIDGGDVCAAV